MDKSNYRNMWVHVEHDGEKIHPVTLELCSEIRKLCDQSGDKLIAVSAGELPESELEKLRGCGADGVIIATGKGYARYSTEAYSDLCSAREQVYALGGVRRRDGERARLCPALCRLP